MIKFNAKQELIGFRQMRSLVDFGDRFGPELYHAYQSANLFDTRETNVATAIGVCALDAADKARIPLGAVMAGLGDLVYCGLTYLALDIKLWRIEGDPDGAVDVCDWIGGGSPEVRQGRVQQLLGIYGRRSNRFLLLSNDHKMTVSNDIGEAFAGADQPFAHVLDAWGLANKLRGSLNGALFIFTPEEA